ncbi:MAG: hypothetical protein KAT48_07635, partial [Bacteroidales bacterium]|nr:hypothetical protein [Bacteroidales bacterium]
MSELETTTNPTEELVQANTESAEGQAITGKTSSQIEQLSLTNPNPVKSEASNQEAKSDGEIEPIADNSEVSAPGSEDEVAKDEVAKDEAAKDEAAKDEAAKDE